MFGEYQTVARGMYLEGLAYDRSRDLIWYSDVIAGGVHGVTPDGMPFATLNSDRMWTGGILLNADGAVLSSGAGGIMWNDPGSGASGFLIDRLAGQPINGVNEMIPDGKDGLYFGTVDIENVAKGEPPRASSIWRLTTRGDVIQASEEIGFANGMMLSRDGSSLFYNDTFEGTFAFEVRDDGSLTGRRKFIDKPDCDGMALDGEGCLWVTGYKSGSVLRVTSDGEIIDQVPTPGPGITQIRFGGTDMRDVYLTSVPLDSGDNLAVGEMPAEKKSSLYRGRSEIAGKPIAPTRFAIA